MSETGPDDSSSGSSRQTAIPANVATSLTSFPDPNTASSPTQHHSTMEPLQGLLDDAGPSMFDEQHQNAENPQSLSAASDEQIQAVVDHRGAVELVRQLCSLLSERDALVTALRRLAEEYDIPRDRIAGTTNRVRLAEQRRLSLIKAAQDSAPTSVSAGSNPTKVDVQVGPNGTIRGFTKLFSGTRRPRETAKTGSINSRASSRSIPGPAPKKDRPQSVDVQSITSVESSNWTSALFGGGPSKNPSGRKRGDSGSMREPVEMSTRRDKDQLPPTLSHAPSDPQEAEWNRFIVKLMKSREQHGGDVKTEQVIGASQFGNEGAQGRHKMETLNRLIIAGIPMRHRHATWMELSNTHAIVQPEGYGHYLNQLRENEDPREIDAILKDVPRTLTSKRDFYTDKGHDRLKNVLVAFVSKYPGLGYTQGLNMIAGYLLLAIPEEADAFWMLCNIIDNYFPLDYFSKEGFLNGPIADNVVLRGYVRELLPRLGEKLDNVFRVEAENTVPLSWFLTGFASVLPEAALLRVWDVWLCVSNQRTFLFNVALTLLSLHAKELLACESESEYLSYVNTRCKVVDEEEEGEQEGGGNKSKDENGAGERLEKINEFVKQAFFLRKKLEQIEIRRALAVKRLRKNPSTEALYPREQEVEQQHHQPEGSG